MLCDVEDSRGGTWGKSGAILFSATRGSPIFRVSADGGTPVAITRSAAASNLAQVGSHRWPYMLPDGEHFVYVDAPTGTCSPNNRLHFASLDGNTDKTITTTCSSAVFAAGNLLYWRDGNLVAQRFDPRSGTATGTPAVIADHVGFDMLFSRAQLSGSNDGKIIYVAGEEVLGAQLIWHDRDGKVLGTLGPHDEFDSISISRDGRRVAYNGNGGLWVLDNRGTKTRLAEGVNLAPSWSADGKRVYFSAPGSASGYDLLSIAADGSSQRQTVLPASEIPGTLGAAQVRCSGDGKYIAFTTSSNSTKLDIYAFALTPGAKPQPVMQSPANESMPDISPDGKWLAYQSDQSGRSDIYVTSFPVPGAQVQVSTGGGEKPIWRRDGKELYYRAPDLRLMAVAVTSQGGTLQFGEPKPLFEMPLRNLNGYSYDVAPDGKFLSNSSLSTEAQTFELLVNWPAELRK